ncbi:cytochrome d ubiquinol oxidase subunit II [Natronolimnohabitans sp. A-GB9]|nr:cytochrome d ubiquinol oxidase subunit II [Natronolimnohabitans sp. A-GB9]MDQ2048864.1 cytochrome d ubiquinol oxidase subunit II [Natronolimnohabitans sp. A-GB9]
MASSVGSVLSPLFIGMLAGSWVFATGAISLPSVLTGIAFVALSAASGAAYLAVKTTGSLRTEMATDGMYASVGALVAIVLLLVVVFVSNPLGIRATLRSVPVGAVVLAAVVLAVFGLLSAMRSAYTRWFYAMGGVSIAFVVLVAVLLYPELYPRTETTVREAVVSPLSLNVLTIVVVPVLALVLAYFRYLYGVFSGPVEPEDGYGMSD